MIICMFYIEHVFGFFAYFVAYLMIIESISRVCHKSTNMKVEIHMRYKYESNLTLLKKIILTKKYVVVVNLAFC